MFALCVCMCLDVWMGVRVHVPACVACVACGGQVGEWAGGGWMGGTRR